VNVTIGETIDVSREAMYVVRKEIETGRKVKVPNRETRDVSGKVMIAGRHPHLIGNKDKIVNSPGRDNFQ
jgi:hypothetical protein